MKHYSEAAVERMMKVQEVILRALAGKIQWWEAAEIVGVSDRTMRRWRWRYQQHGYEALVNKVVFDRWFIGFAQNEIETKH